MSTRRAGFYSAQSEIVPLLDAMARVDPAPTE